MESTEHDIIVHHSTAGDPSSSTEIPLKEQDLVNKWCIVEYDSRPYVGKILSQEDDSVEVHELRRVGENKFVETDNDQLTLWYDYDKVIALIEAPVHKSKRQLSLDVATWNKYFT